MCAIARPISVNKKPMDMKKSYVEACRNKFFILVTIILFYFSCVSLGGGFTVMPEITRPPSWGSQFLLYIS